MGRLYRLTPGLALPALRNIRRSWELYRAQNFIQRYSVL
jgi:hypothetical protein